jgi:hypothetical protein
MGLDVHLYQFEGVDTEAILKLAQFSELPVASRDRGTLAAKASELGLSQKIIPQPGFGGTQISFPSTKHPEWPVGDWYSFGTIRALLHGYFGKDLYFIFPKAKNLHGLFRPDWAEARKRLNEILQTLHRLEPAQWASVFGSGGRQNSALNQLEVMIETLDFVLNSDNPREFLLFWSE